MKKSEKMYKKLVKQIRKEMLESRIENYVSILRYGFEKEPSGWCDKPNCNGKFQPQEVIYQKNSEIVQRKVSQNEQSNGKIPSEDLIQQTLARFQKIETKTEVPASIVENLRAESESLEIALDYILNSKKCHSPQCEISRAKELEQYLCQCNSFQKLVSQQILPLLEKIHNSKI